jgi:rod shape-determining protein MreC
MEGFLNRYRNITVLLLVIFAQLLLLAVQVKNDQDVRMIRVWTVSAVTPAARILEGLRGGGVGFIRSYVTLHDTNAENRRLQEEVGRLKLENTFLKNEINRADRAKALEMFQARTPSKMLAASIIAMGAGSNSKVVFVDRGSVSGVMRGMPVVTPDGIVGKVIAAYPTASEVQLINDSDFAAGVVLQKSQVRGTLKGEGTPLCRLDYVPIEDKVAPGDMVYTSGDDRIFPQGFPVGVVKSVRPGSQYLEIQVEPSGLQRGMEDVLILLQGVHQEIPDTPTGNQPIYIAPPPPGTSPTTQVTTPNPAPGLGTDADKLRAIYKSAGEAQNFTFGGGPQGVRPPDFTKLPTSVPAHVPGPTGAVSRPAPTGAVSRPAPTGAVPRPAPTGAAPRPAAAAPAPTGSLPAAPAPPTETPKKQATTPLTDPDAIRRAKEAGGIPKGQRQ